VLFFEAFPLPDFLGRVYDSPQFQALLREVIADDDEYLIARIQRAIGNGGLQFLSQLWRNPDLLLASVRILDWLRQLLSRPAPEDAQRVLEAFLTLPHSAGAARLVSEFADEFVYSEAVKGNLDAISRFAGNAIPSDLTVLKVVAGRSRDFVRDLVSKLCDNASQFANQLGAVHRASVIAEYIPDGEEQREAMGCVAVAMMECLSDLQQREQSAILDRLAGSIERGGGEPPDWEGLLLSQIFELSDAVLDPMPKFLRVAVSRMDLDSLRTQIETLATGLADPENLEAFGRAVKFLVLCFGLRPEAREIFESFGLVDEALLEKWPEQYQEYRHRFVKA
jgi:hypothetical protein